MRGGTSRGRDNLLTKPINPAPTTALATPANDRGIARGADGWHFTVKAPTPYAVDPDRDMCARKSANAAMFAGTFNQAATLYRSTVGESGSMSGILNTFADGLLVSPRPFHGDPEMVSALSDTDGTIGDDSIMFPFVEMRQCVAEMMGFGYALGQNTLSCWRCRAFGNENWHVCKAVNSIGGEYVHEVCCRCDASRYDRPVGVREIFSMQHWDLSALWQERYSKQWHVNHRNGTIPIRPGDGEWCLFRTVPEIDGFLYAPYLWAVLAAILSRDAGFDIQATSMVSTPTVLFESDAPNTPESRLQAEKEAEKLAFQNRIILPHGWKYSIVNPDGTYNEVGTSIISRLFSEFQIGVFGNVIVGTKGEAFTDSTPFFRVADTRRAAAGQMVAAQKRVFSHEWWALENYGTRNAPLQTYDTASPQDKKARADALFGMGTALSAIAKGLADHGLESDPQDIVEMMQQLGRCVRKKEGGDAGKLPLGVNAVGSLVKGDEGRAGLGLGPFGDERDNKTINQLADEAQANAPVLPTNRPRRKARR
jgi:hypothetical protein